MLYLKYRPQTWQELDSEVVRTTLGKAILNNDWAHAYLLIGTRGIGKTTTARLIAKTVNCPNRKKGEEPCNQCDFCKSITKGNSLDVIEIDAASNTGVEDIRLLREKVKLATSGAKFKVYIIDEAHMLSTSAFNALLKTLEEPPAHVIFVLCTTDPQKLPETIVSRCLVYDFGRAIYEEIKHGLKRVIAAENYKVTEELVEIVISKANGSHRDAVKILEQMMISGQQPAVSVLVAVAVKEVAEKLVNFILENKKTEALEELEKYVKDNGRIKELLGEMVGVLRDKLLSDNPGQAAVLISKLIEANSLLRDSTIASLPLELVIVEWCGSDKSEKSENSENRNDQKIREPEKPEKSDESDTPTIRSSECSDFSEKWSQIVAATKPYNHSLNAFLKAARPVGVRDNFLIIEVAYKFHKEKLEEPKNRDVLEKVISDIMGKEIKVRFELKKAT